MDITHIYYTKRFLSGMLKGLEVPCSISFPKVSTADYAKRYRVGVKGRDCLTESRFLIVDASFQNYQR